MLPVELVLESVGNDYPGLVREALTAKEPNTTCSGALSSSGYAWLIVGRNLYVWKYEPEDDQANAPTVLILPPSGLPYNAQTVCVYSRQGFTTPGVIVVTPEGIVRHWPTIDRQNSDSSVDLDREVVLSLTRINLEPLDGTHFLLATTTCSFFLLTVNMSVVPTPGKRQRLSSEIIIKVIHTNTKTGIGGKLASAFFGEGRQPGSRLMKALIYEQSDTEVRGLSSKTVSTSNAVAVKNLHILAVTEHHLHSYSLGQSSKIWSCEMANMGSEHFALDLWNLRDVGEHGRWHQEVKTWILDAVNVRDGVLVLFACMNRAVSTQIHFALGYVSEYGSNHAPLALEWFFVLKALSNECRSNDEDALANIALRLPTDSEQGSHDKVEGVLLVTLKTIYSIRLPDQLHKKAPPKLILCASYNATLISSARDTRYVYVFLKEKGLQRAKLLPRGFDANLAQSIAQMNKVEMLDTSLSNVAADRRTLAKAFYLFSEADMLKSGAMMQELLENRHIGIAQMCTEYAIDLVDAVPNDERWSATGKSPQSGQVASKSSLLLEVHLEEQKKRVLAMFVLFIKNAGVEDKLDRTVITHLSHSRSARSQIVELIEKIGIAVALYKWSKENPSPILNAAIKRALSKRKEGSEGELLTREDYFFREISRVHELFDGLLEEEEEIIGNDEIMLEDKLECIEYIGAALIVVKETVDEYREANVLEIENDLRWTQEKEVLMPFIQHLSILFGCIEPGGRGCPKFRTLLKQALLIGAFIMNEQLLDDRQNSPIVAKFLEIGERTAALELAKHFQDYKSIIRLVCALPDAERKARIQEYKEFFNSSDFSNVLYEYYLENGNMKDLLEEKGSAADIFFATRTNLIWMRDIRNDDFVKASHILKSLSQESNDDVIHKKRLLSFAKLAALCEDEVDNGFLEELKSDLRLTKHQEKVDPGLKQKFASFVPSPKIRASTAEEIIQTHLNNPKCGVDHCFDALLTFSTLLDEKTSHRKADLIRSLHTKIWLTVIRIDKDYWKEVKRDEPENQTVYNELLKRIIDYDALSSQRKLELIPNIEELTECLTELSHNKLFVVLLRTAEEAARRSISGAEPLKLPMKVD